jgi:hypothetical protein
MFLHVTEARYLDAYRIEVAFNNGKKGIADLADALKLTVRSIFLEVHEIVAEYFYIFYFYLPPWKHQYT